jgi:hypothetical protein
VGKYGRFDALSLFFLARRPRFTTNYPPTNLPSPAQRHHLTVTRRAPGLEAMRNRRSTITIVAHITSGQCATQAPSMNDNGIRGLQNDRWRHRCLSLPKVREVLSCRLQCLSNPTTLGQCSATSKRMARFRPAGSLNAAAATVSQFRPCLAAFNLSRANSNRPVDLSSPSFQDGLSGELCSILRISRSKTSTTRHFGN